MLKRMWWTGCILCLAILAGCATGSFQNSLISSDSDSDGVSHQIDRCPATPVGVAVDINGCPADSDNDGVFDTLDRCPGTATAQIVDLHGCNMDDDSDGVFDWRDHCLHSTAGVAVESDGCASVSPSPVAETVTGHKPAPKTMATADRKLIIYFEANQSTVLPEFRSMLEHLATGLEPDQIDAIGFRGHTDSTGSEGYNFELGKRRAQRAAALLAASAPQLASFMDMESLGETEPVADNATPMGRLLNRRVEIRVRLKDAAQVAGYSPQ